MRRLPKTHKKLPMKKEDEPDFYKMSKENPLPPMEEILAMTSCGPLGSSSSMPSNIIIPSPLSAVASSMAHQQLQSQVNNGGGGMMMGQMQHSQLQMQMQQQQHHHNINLNLNNHSMSSSGMNRMPSAFHHNTFADSAFDTFGDPLMVGMGQRRGFAAASGGNMGMSATTMQGIQGLNSMPGMNQHHHHHGSGMSSFAGKMGMHNTMAGLNTLREQPGLNDFGGLGGPSSSSSMMGMVGGGGGSGGTTSVGGPNSELDDPFTRLRNIQQMKLFERSTPTTRPTPSNLHHHNMMGGGGAGLSSGGGVGGVGGMPSSVVSPYGNDPFTSMLQAEHAAAYSYHMNC
jgi:hypothetical protein